jgi:hypothetical protein
MIYALYLSAYLYIVGCLMRTVLLAKAEDKHVDQFGMDEWWEVALWPLLMAITLIAAWWNE